MTRKESVMDVSVKSTKEQILAAYHKVLEQLNEKQVMTPQRQKKKEEERDTIDRAGDYSSESIIGDLANLKSKTIKQIDVISEELINQFQKLVSLKEVINLGQKHLQELYQINETANTLSALLQAQNQQKEQFQVEMEQQKQVFEEEMANKRLYWQQQNLQLEAEYKDKKAELEKARNREQEEYHYNLKLEQRKELDSYANQKILLEKELESLKEDLSKRVAEIKDKEEEYKGLKIEISELPNTIKAAVEAAEATLREKLSTQHSFEAQLKHQEYENNLKVNEQCIYYLETKIKEQELLIKDLTKKADSAAEQVQAIACRALDTSAQRFVSTNLGENKNT